MRVLYVSNNGLLEPIGRSQIFRYVMAQSARHRFTIISLEKPDDAEDAEARQFVEAQLRSVGATWVPLRYSRNRPRVLFAGWNLFRGMASVLRRSRVERIDVIHARSYLGALMALPASAWLGIPFLFDMRGFWPDEGIGVGRWAKDSLTYRVLKRLERVLLRRAGGMVTLTESGAEHLRNGFPEARGDRPIAVIPTCADLEKFHLASGASSSPLVLGYAGSANEAYLFEEFILTFLELQRRRPDARMLILNRKDHAYIHRELAAKGVAPSQAEVKSVDHEHMPDEMRRVTLGTIFVRPYLAKIGSAPTKMAEFLATGVPCLGNAGCGDVAAILERERVGVAIDAFTPENISRMVDRALHLLDDRDLAARCRTCAQKMFSMEMACRAYDRLYAELRGARPAAAS